MEIFAFEVSLENRPEWAEIINHRSRGKAKSQYLSSVLDAGWEVKYTDVRCRKVGGPQTSRRFEDNAKYRGLPDVRCGQRVTVGKSCGVIVGHNSSANFNVLFDADDPQYPDLTLNVHPSECVFI